jgi:hypothetical protein
MQGQAFFKIIVLFTSPDLLEPALCAENFIKSRGPRFDPRPGGYSFCQRTGCFCQKNFQFHLVPGKKGKKAHPGIDPESFGLGFQARAFTDRPKIKSKTKTKIAAKTRLSTPTLRKRACRSGARAADRAPGLCSRLRSPGPGQQADMLVPMYLGRTLARTLSPCPLGTRNSCVIYTVQACVIEAARQIHQRSEFGAIESSIPPG